VEAFLCVRPIERLRVFSPTRANRERFAAEMRERHGIDAAACDSPAEVYRGAHIVAALTDSTAPVLEGERLEPGAHIVNVGGGGVPDAASLARIDRCLRFGSAPSPTDRDDLALHDVTSGAKPGRLSDSDITWSERGNLQGVQFFALAAHVYESARKLGLGRELPTEWLLQ